MRPDPVPTAGPRRKRTGKKIGVIAGSGLAGLGDRFQAREVVSFADIEGVGPCTVEGHLGEVRFCVSGGRECVLVLGRKHAYEGGRLGMDRVIEWLARHGVTGLVVISAAGSLRNSFRPGELVVVESIIDMQNLDRLQKTFRTAPPSNAARGRRAGGFRGRTERRWGKERLSVELTVALKRAATKAGVNAGRGTLACCVGPAYESPAEARMLQNLGADVATMSAAPEVRIAARAGMDVAVIAAVTNAATGTSGAPGADITHGHVLETAGNMSNALALVIEELIRNNYLKSTQAPPGGHGG